MSRERLEWGSPPTRVDRDHLDNFEWTPELLTEYADRARHVIDTLWQTDVANLERADEGTCDECSIETQARFIYGHFVLCRVCARRRRKVANNDGGLF